jgi:hypothetical protein
VRGFEVVASVIAAFFVIGIGVGVLLVVAMPALRSRRGTRDIGREDDYRHPYGLPPGYDNSDGPGWQEPPPDPDDDDVPPPWPGRRG